MNKNPRQSKHKPNAQQGGEVIMVQHHNDADVMSVEQVVDYLLNPNDPNQKIPKLIKVIARRIAADDPSTQDDVIQAGMLYATQRIHDKWCKPSDSGETIVSLGQMVRAITSNKFVLEKQMTIEAQNATSSIQIKDNYRLYEERKTVKSNLTETGQSENQSYETNIVNSEGEESDGMTDKMFMDAPGGITPSGHKLYEQLDYETEMHWNSLRYIYKQLLPRLSERDQQLYEYKIRLQLTDQEIANILRLPNANVVKQRWKRLRKLLEKLAGQYQRNKKQAVQTAKLKQPKTLIETELVKAAIKHGIMSQEVEMILGNNR